MARVDSATANSFERSVYDKAVNSVNDRSSIIEDLVQELVTEYTMDLDKLITDVKSALYQNHTLTDREVDFFIMKIPLEVYALIPVLSNLETKENVAKVSQKIAYNEARLQASGTVADKDAKAEQAVETESLVSLVFTRARKLSNDKKDIALELLASLKKVSSSRISERELTRFSNN